MDNSNNFVELSKHPWSLKQVRANQNINILLPLFGGLTPLDERQEEQMKKAVKRVCVWQKWIAVN